MELDIRSLFGLHVQSCTHRLRPRSPRPSRIWAHIRGRYWSAKIDNISTYLCNPLVHAKFRVQEEKAVHHLESISGTVIFHKNNSDSYIYWILKRINAGLVILLSGELLPLFAGNTATPHLRQTPRSH